MSFSVKASEYTPDVSYISSSSTPTGSKQCICIAFYKSGECPYGNFCEHAHHFSELHHDAKANFFSNVSLGEVAPHFVSSTPKFADTPYRNSADTTPDRWGSFTGGADRAQDYMHGEASNSKGGVPSFPTGSPTGRFFADYYDGEKTYSTREHAASHAAAPINVSPFSTTASFSTQGRTLEAAFLSSPISHKASRRGADTSSTTSSNSHVMSSGCSAAADKPYSTPHARKNPSSLLPQNCQYPHRFPGTYYNILGLPFTASHDDVIAQYRRWHKEGYRRAREEDSERAERHDCLVVEARNVLGNRKMKAEYDGLLREAGVI